MLCHSFNRPLAGCILFLVSCLNLFLVFLACQARMPCHFMLKARQFVACAAFHNWLVVATVMNLTGAAIEGTLKEEG